MNRGMQFIYERPAAPRKRLLRAAVAAPITLAILLPLAFFATGDTSRPMLAQFPLESMMLIISIILMLTILLLGSLPERASRFYVIEQAVQIPASIGLVGLGVNLLGLTQGIALIATGVLSSAAILIQVSSRIKVRILEIQDNIESHQPMSLKDGKAIWHSERDALTVTGKEYSRRRGPVQSFLFWLGPATGAAAASLLGTELTPLFVGIIVFGVGLWMLVIKVEVAIAFHQELSRLEREYETKMYLARPD